MGKAIAGFMRGLVCLFLFSLTYGANMFPAGERRLSAESRLEEKYPLDQGSLAEKESRGKKIRLSMNSFDLANGLTFQELEDISLEPGYRFAAFFYLLASLWLVWGLRISRSHS